MPQYPRPYAQIHGLDPDTSGPGPGDVTIVLYANGDQREQANMLRRLADLYDARSDDG